MQAEFDRCTGKGSGGWHFDKDIEHENGTWFKECQWCHRRIEIDSNYEYDEMSQERN